MSGFKTFELFDGHVCQNSHQEFWLVKAWKKDVGIWDIWINRGLGVAKFVWVKNTSELKKGDDYVNVDTCS
jgi:hypothetical protein